MLILFARIFAVVFSILVISKSILSYKARKESMIMTIFWLVTWLAISAFAFFPSLINKVLGAPNAKGGAGTVLAIGLIFLYFIIYRVYVKADRVEKQLNKIIRLIALNNSEKT